jgi:tetratricopeptide (TPR) repeat protein
MPLDDAVPSQADAYARYLSGLHLLRGGQALAAAGLLEAAVAVLPGHERARVNLVRAWLAAGAAREAAAAAQAGLALWPHHAELLFSHGTALSALGHAAHARDALTAAVAQRPKHAPSHLNLGNACADLDDLAGAEIHIREALRLDPDLVEAHASLGFVLTSLGRLPEATAACDSAIARQPDCAQAHWNLAIAALLAGDFARGFAEYEWRKRHDQFRRDFIDLPGPVWEGGDPSGRRILLHAEQGLGDTIQFARYAVLIAAQGGCPVLACERSLLPLLGTIPGVAAVAKDAPLPAYDVWADQMSLPRLFGTRMDSVPLAEGYLRADPGRMAWWRDRLPAGRRIGLAWAGNPAHSNDRRRSLPPGVLRRLLAPGRGIFVNLQVGPRAAEAGLQDMSPLLTDYAETAALIANLDLVLTVDTSVAHLAGALGVPCWVMLPFAPDWRWLLGRDDSPWYRSLRLFRQTRAGDWQAVIDAVRAALAPSCR